MVKKPVNAEADVHQPHDKIVKQFLNDPAQVKDFLIAYLPKNILVQMDLNHLKLQPNHYIDHTQRLGQCFILLLSMNFLKKFRGVL